MDYSIAGQDIALLMYCVFILYIFFNLTTNLFVKVKMYYRKLRVMETACNGTGVSWNIDTRQCWRRPQGAAVIRGSN